jgi:hypothetical protein
VVLLIVGEIKKEHIPIFKKTRKYSVADYLALIKYMNDFNEIVITPNIATEASNLLGTLNGEYKKTARILLSALTLKSSERYVASIDAVKDNDYVRLGLPDAGIIVLGKEVSEVITDDFDLYLSLLNRSIAVKNFTHMRKL